MRYLACQAFPAAGRRVRHEEVDCVLRWTYFLVLPGFGRQVNFWKFKCNMHLILLQSIHLACYAYGAKDHQLAWLRINKEICAFLSEKQWIEWKYFKALCSSVKVWSSLFLTCLNKEKLRLMVWFCIIGNAQTQRERQKATMLTGSSFPIRASHLSLANTPCSFKPFRHFGKSVLVMKYAY